MELCSQTPVTSALAGVYDKQTADMAWQYGSLKVTNRHPGCHLFIDAASHRRNNWFRTKQ